MTLPKHTFIGLLEANSLVVLRCISGSRPWDWWLRRPPSQVTLRRRSIWDPKELKIHRTFQQYSQSNMDNNFFFDPHMITLVHGPLACPRTFPLSVYNSVGEINLCCNNKYALIKPVSTITFPPHLVKAGSVASTSTINRCPKCRLARENNISIAESAESRFTLALGALALIINPGLKTRKPGNPEKYSADPPGGDLDSFEVSDLYWSIDDGYSGYE